MNRRHIASILLLGCMFLDVAYAAPTYKTIAAVALGGPEHWDYATYDPDGKRIYVAHGDKLSVVDATTLKVIGNIAPIPGGSHGSVVASGVGFTDDGKAGTVAAFDPKTLKITASLPAAPDADGIVQDLNTGDVLIINGDSGSVTVIDPKGPKVAGTIDVGTPLEFGVSDGQGHFYVDGVDKNEIIAINTATKAVEAHWPMPDCQSPHGLAIDAVTRRLFATCSNKTMVVVNADTGEVVTSVPIGAFNDGVAFDPIHKIAIAANGEGTLTIVKERDPQTFEVVATIPTQKSARTIALDPATGRVFLPAADIATFVPAAGPDGHPKVTYVPGSLKLLVLDPN